MGNVLNGTELSKQMRDMVAEMCCQFELKYGHPVGLAIIQVGDNPSATSYVKNNLRLCKEVGIAMSFKEQGCDEEKWLNDMDKLAFLAYEDQCSPANPKVPMLEDIKEILKNSYYGDYKLDK